MAYVFFTETVLLALLFFLVIATIWHKKKNRNAIVTTWPVLGMFPGLLHNFGRLHDFATELLQKSGGTFEFESPILSNMDFIITCDPMNIQYILNTNFDNYPKGKEFREVFDALGDGILSADSDLWRVQRKMIQLWNARQSKNGFVSKTIQRKVVNDLIPFLENVSQTGIQVDIQEVFEKMITFDNAISLIFGLDLSSHNFKLPIDDYQKAFGDMQETVLGRHVVPASIWKLKRWLRVGGERKYTRALKIFDEFMYECIALKREERLKNHEEEAKFDLISTYLEEKANSYPDKFLKDVALNLTAAARDTFTSTLTWFFWLVATHPRVEAKILEEMNENLPAGFLEEMGAEYLSKLVYLQAVFQETLRLYPPVPLNHKTAARRDTLPSGHYVEAKKRVLISFYSTARMEEIWGKDCLEFKPERWIDHDSEHGIRLVYVPPNKFPAFNVGPRTCLGKDLAFVQSKIVAINVLRNFRFRMVQGHPITPSLTITLHMKHGFNVNVSKRCSFRES